MVRKTKYSLWIVGIIAIFLWAVFAFCFPLDNVNAPEIDDSLNTDKFYCDDGSLCPMSNKGEQTSELYQESSSENYISREEAEDNIRKWKYTSILQAHSLKVWLTSKDWTTFITTEPEIDEVSKIIEECGDPCKKISLATE